MRNLEILTLLEEDIRNQGGNITHFTIGGDSNDVFFVTEKNILFGYHPLNNKLWLELHLEQDQLLPENSQIINLEYIPDLEAVCLATKGGEIISYEISSNEAECVGVIDSGITSMSWSPDYELVVFATGNQTILLMTKNWDVVVETPQPNSQGSVGENLPTISWRGDGQYFVVNITKDGSSSLIVYDRECHVNSTSQSVNGLGHLVSWKPSGALICSYQILPQRQDIVFFERNGLRHGEFTLRDQSAKVLDIKWNSDSDLLALLLRLVSGETVLQLWSSSNYHWFLKQEFHYRQQVISQFKWDLENPMILRLISTDGTFLEYNFCWNYHISGGSNSAASATVIDGKNIKITPFRFVLTPPPAAYFTLTAQSNVTHVDWQANSTNLLALLADNSLSFFIEDTGLINLKSQPTFKGTLSLEDLGITRARQIIYASSSTIIALNAGDDHNDVVTLIEFSFQNGVVSVMKSNSLKPGKKVMRIFQNKDTGSIFIHTSDGSILHMASDSLKEVQKLPSSCPWICTTTAEEKEIFIGLDRRSKLYINNEMICSDCNSFAVNGTFLIFTSIGGKSIRFVPLSQPIKDIVTDCLASAAQISEKYGDYIREVERGAKIVTAIPDDFKVILQMPRGNLEAIYPRILLLDILRKILDKNEFGKAFLLMRKHRVDLNLLYDHNPQRFVENVQLFVEQVQDIEFLNLFISSLGEDDVTKTMYPNPLAKEKIMPQKGVAKVNIICSKLREELNKRDANKYLLSVLTTYVRSNPPQVEEALKLIKSRREHEVNVGKEGQMSAEKALKYVCWLVDVDRLYDIALGMYDFELVMMVAQKSQKDPKEYMGFLSSLALMETYFQRYTIDKYLQRHESSLRNLSKAGDEHFETCVHIMKAHNLYEVAMEIYADKKPQLDVVLDAYGDYLIRKGNFTEAAMLHINCSQLSKALSSLKQTNEWRTVFVVAQKLKFSPEELKSLGYEIAEAMQSISKYQEAATIYLTYCSDPEQAIVSLINGNQWQEALRLCHSHNREDLIQTNLQPGALESVGTQLEELEENREKLIKQRERLEIVRTNKLLMPKLMEKEGVEPHDDTTSIVSGMSMISGTTTSSVMSSVSTSSGYSGYSSLSLTTKERRQQRKQKKRKTRMTGKEGSLLEEEYLIGAIKQLIPTSTSQEDIGNLVKILVYFGHIKQASKLQRAFKEYLNEVTIALPLLTPVTTVQASAQSQSGTSEVDKWLEKIDWDLKLWQ